MSSGSSERSSKYCFKLYPVAYHRNLPSQTSPYTCFSLKCLPNFLFFAAGSLEIDSCACERKNNHKSFSLLLVKTGHVTLSDPLGGLLIRRGEEVVFYVEVSYNVLLE